MNFFEQQARARRDSRRLLLLFLLAVLGVVLTLDALVLLALRLDEHTGQLPLAQAAQQSAPLLAGIGIALAAVILLASLYKIASLGSGGATVARALGGEAVPPGSTDPRLRRLRNVVEEMAIAASLPVPAIYWLPQETGINAFAAGYSPADAAITVTRGALDKLTRDELQGVIGHEFSHILNGDMRLNLRMMGLLFGILIIAIAGRKVMRLSAQADDARGALAGIAAGLAMTLVGYVGYVFGQLIRAGVSRQREYLADASAVQFTRQTSGLAGALKKLAGVERGARLDAAGREDVSHMLFGDGVGYHALFATHPPILERIRVLEPGFVPSSLKALAKTWNDPAFSTVEEELPAAAALAPAAAGLSLEPAAVRQQVAAPTDADMQRAGVLYAALPAGLSAAAREPAQAPDLLCALLLDPDPAARAPQLTLLAAESGAARREAVEALAAPLATLHPAQRLPLAELAFPALRHLPRAELTRLMRLLGQLIQADGRVSLFEYCLGRLLRQQMQDLLHPAAAARSSGRERLHTRLPAVQRVLSVLAEAGHADPAAAGSAFRAGAQALLPQHMLGYAPLEDWHTALDPALTELDALMPSAKELLIEALVRVMSHDGRVTVAEAELLRVICGALRCPLPPTLGVGA